MSTDLEALLRAHPITNGVIQLNVLPGDDGRPSWMCSVSHRQGYMTHHMGRCSTDPVEAMRLALIADEQHDREVRKKYVAAAKITDGDDDFGDLLG